MTKDMIIEEMAKSRVVERAIEGMTHQALDYDLSDLSQMIYLALLEQPEGRITDLYENREIEFFIRGIIKKQAFSQTSPFYKTIRKFRDITDDIESCYDIEDSKGNGNDRESLCR